MNKRTRQDDLNELERLSEECARLQARAMAAEAVTRRAEDLLAMSGNLSVLRLRPREQLIADGIHEQNVVGFLTDRGWVWDAVQREWRCPIVERTGLSTR